jgi:tripartite-type tricarboxylate transporter receptor subunit TctC
MSLVTGLLACLWFILPLASQAQNYPNQPVRVIVPVGPGGGYDLLARIVSPGLSSRLGQPVVVENRPGAGSLIGTEAAARAPHDGHTLLIGGLSNIAANAGLYKNLPYDPSDFKVLSLSINHSLCLVGRKDLPQSTLKGFIEHARANPGKLQYGSAGVGSAQHVVMALLAHFTEAQLVHVPYKGAGAVMSDLLAGRIDVFFNNCAAVRKFVDAGQVKALAVSWRERTPAMPDVPSIVETKVAPLVMDSWMGFFVGAKTPQPVVDKLRAEIAAVLADPEVVKRLEQDGGKLFKLSIRDSEEYVRSEINRWRTLIPKVGISLD